MTAIAARVSRAAEEATTADELWILDVDGATVIVSPRHPGRAHRDAAIAELTGFEAPDPIRIRTDAKGDPDGHSSSAHHRASLLGPADRIGPVANSAAR